MFIRKSVNIAVYVFLLSCQTSSGDRFDPDRASYDTRTARLGPAGVEQVVAVVDSSFFNSVPPQLGRTLQHTDFTGDTKVVLISHQYWTDEMSGSPAAIGTSITVNDVPHTIVGIMPRGIDVPEHVSAWMPRSDI